MDVAIIGPGNMGLGIARLLVAKGNTVSLVHKDLVVAEKAAGKLGERAQAHDIAQAVAKADIVILATPYEAAAFALVAAGDLTGKIVVDITNPITPDYMALTIGHTTSSAEEIAKIAPEAHIVKAFNTVFWQALPFDVRVGKPAVQVLLASDNANAKAAVASLVSSLEFYPIDAGPLKNARYIEPIGEMNINFGYALTIRPNATLVRFVPLGRHLNTFYKHTLLDRHQGPKIQVQKHTSGVFSIVQFKAKRIGFRLVCDKAQTDGTDARGLCFGGIEHF